MDAQIRANDLLPPGGEVTALVSGGADSTCLWHVLGALGYRVSALHVDHGLRGRESTEDAGCREVLGAEVVDGRGGSTEELREIRYFFATDLPRATVTPPPIRWRRSSTGSSRAEQRPASRRSVPTASSGRS